MSEAMLEVIEKLLILPATARGVIIIQKLRFEFSRTVN